jgi:hypothetical protein
MTTAPSKLSQLEDSRLSAVAESSFDILSATLHARSICVLHSKPGDEPCSSDKLYDDRVQ